MLQDLLDQAGVHIALVGVEDEVLNSHPFWLSVGYFSDCELDFVGNHNHWKGARRE